MALHLELYGRYNLESMGYNIIIIVKGHELGVGRKMGVGLGGEVKGRSRVNMIKVHCVKVSKNYKNIYFLKELLPQGGYAPLTHLIGSPNAMSSMLSVCTASSSHGDATTF